MCRHIYLKLFQKLDTESKMGGGAAAKHLAMCTTCVCAPVAFGLACTLWACVRSHVAATSLRACAASGMPRPRLNRSRSPPSSRASETPPTTASGSQSLLPHVEPGPLSSLSPLLQPAPPPLPPPVPHLPLTEPGTAVPATNELLRLVGHHVVNGHLCFHLLWCREHFDDIVFIVHVTDLYHTDTHLIYPVQVRL